MKRLAGVAELLDGPLDDPVALAANLRDLARINRLTGGTRLSEQAIAAFAGPGAVGSILDVGTGGADIPLTLLARARARGRTLTITATDSRPEILAAARHNRPALESCAGLVLELADGRALPYPDASFDVAHASLVAHHLEPDEAVAFLRELRRVARRGVVVNDLLRSRLSWVGGKVVVHALAMSRYTRNDGPLSVRRAYTRPELLELISRAGLEPVAAFAGFAGHRLAVAAR